MSERIHFWRCSHCFGTGLVFEPYMQGPLQCLKCDGTGKAMVDGEAERHKRRIQEWDSAPAKGGDG